MYLFSHLCQLNRAISPNYQRVTYTTSDIDTSSWIMTASKNFYTKLIRRVSTKFHHRTKTPFRNKLALPARIYARSIKVSGQRWIELPKDLCMYIAERNPIKSKRVSLQLRDSIPLNPRDPRHNSAYLRSWRYRAGGGDRNMWRISLIEIFARLFSPLPQAVSASASQNAGRDALSSGGEPALLKRIDPVIYRVTALATSLWRLQRGKKWRRELRAVQRGQSIIPTACALL